MLSTTPRSDSDQMVEAELSASTDAGRQTMSLPLGVRRAPWLHSLTAQLYVDWLTADEATRQRLGSTPYLAQQRLNEIVRRLSSPRGLARAASSRTS